MDLANLVGGPDTDAPPAAAPAAEPKVDNDPKEKESPEPPADAAEAAQAAEDAPEAARTAIHAPKPVRPKARRLVGPDGALPPAAGLGAALPASGPARARTREPLGSSSPGCTTRSWAAASS